MMAIKLVRGRGRRVLALPVACAAATLALTLCGMPAANAEQGAERRAGQAVAKSARGLQSPSIVVATHPARTGTAANPCFPVDAIEISGGGFDRLLPRETIIAAVSPHAEACQGNESVGALLKAVNGLFAGKGYVTTQAWLPEQDIAGTRRLKISVVPGRVDRIVYSEQRTAWHWFGPRMTERGEAVMASTDRQSAWQQTVAFWDALDDDLDALTLLPLEARLATTRQFRDGDILHVDPLQDTLDALNRVPSMKAAAELKPGANRPLRKSISTTASTTPSGFMAAMTPNRSKALTACVSVSPPRRTT